MASVTVHRLTKRFDAVMAVDGLDVAVQDGEFLTLLGPSGCGKSTALACIAGLEKPSDGAILSTGRTSPNSSRMSVTSRWCPGLCALSAHDRAGEHELRPAPAARRPGEHRAPGGRRRRDARSRSAAPKASGRAQRRTAAASRGRSGRGAQSLGPADGRAALQSRRWSARAHPDRDQAAAARTRHHRDLRHPRPGRGDGPLGSDRGYARRPAKQIGPPMDVYPSRATCSSPPSSVRRR